jgi:hypothetical protein
MTTTRTPIRRASKSRITPVVIALFKQMEELSTKCTCPPTDWVTPDAYWKDSGDDCPACEEWWDLHERLHNMLDLPICQWPAFEHPDAQCPYPAGCYAAEDWHKRRASIERAAALELYAALKKAAEEPS